MGSVSLATNSFSSVSFLVSSWGLLKLVMLATMSEHCCVAASLHSFMDLVEDEYVEAIAEVAVVVGSVLGAAARTPPPDATLASTATAFVVVSLGMPTLSNDSPLVTRNKVPSIYPAFCCLRLTATNKSAPIMQKQRTRKGEEVEVDACSDLEIAALVVFRR